VSNLAELAHSGSLIIDDIQDHSLLRRGGTCIHARYGKAVAISVANTLYFLSFHHLFGHPHLTRSQQLEIHEIIIKQFTRAHFGQALDLYWTRNLTNENLDQWMNDSLESKIFQMYQLKTAAPLEGLAEAAAVIADADDDVRRACIRFARSMGIAFQIVDDINNFSTSKQWRKKSGEDISEGKVTYVIVNVLKSLEDSDRERFMTILTNKMLRKEDALLGEAVDLVERSGVLEKCRRQAKEMVETEWRGLERLLAPSEPKIFIQTMVHSLLKIT
jgi:geranylgeranyl pyrophosphate synthase